MFRILEKEAMEMFGIGERSTSKRKFSGTKTYDIGEVRKYFINLK